MSGILIVEATGEIQNAIQLALAGGNDLIVASTFERAQTDLRSNEMDLMIIDLDLSDGQGMDVCKKMMQGMEPDCPTFPGN